MTDNIVSLVPKSDGEVEQARLTLVNALTALDEGHDDFRPQRAVVLLLDDRNACYEPRIWCSSDRKSELICLLESGKIEILKTMGLA